MQQSNLGHAKGDQFGRPRVHFPRKISSKNVFKDKHMSKTEDKQNTYKNLLMENEWGKGKLENYRTQSLAFKYKYPFDLPVCFVRG